MEIHRFSGKMWIFVKNVEKWKKWKKNVEKCDFLLKMWFLGIFKLWLGN